MGILDCFFFQIHCLLSGEQQKNVLDKKQQKHQHETCSNNVSAQWNCDSKQKIRSGVHCFTFDYCNNHLQMFQLNFVNMLTLLDWNAPWTLSQCLSQYTCLFDFFCFLEEKKQFSWKLKTHEPTTFMADNNLWPALR